MLRAMGWSGRVGAGGTGTAIGAAGPQVGRPMPDRIVVNITRRKPSPVVLAMTSMLPGVENAWL